MLDLLVLSKAIVPKPDRTLDTQELLPLIFLNMVVCLNHKDLNQPDRWLINSLQANMVSKATVAHQLSLQDNTQISRWGMAVLPVLEVMAVVLNILQLLNGAHPLHNKPSGTALAVTRVNFLTEMI